MSFQKKILLSFIIPVHNAQNTIESCFNSIIHDIGESTDCEIILIENGSTDDTENLLLQCKEAYNQTHILHSEKGVSYARNAGLDAALGEYIVFVDADDCWEYGALETIRRQLLTENHLYVFSYKKGNKTIKIDKNLHKHHFENEEVDTVISWLLARPTIRCTVWAKVYNTRLIKANNIRFDERLSFSEDSDFLMKYLKCCASVKISDNVIYQYTINPFSSVHSVDSFKIDTYISDLMLIKTNVADNSASIAKAFPQYLLNNLNVILVNQVFSYGGLTAFFKQVEKMKDLVQQSIFREAIGNTDLKTCFCFQLLPEALLKLRLPFLAAMVCRLKATLNKYT